MTAETTRENDGVYVASVGGAAIALPCHVCGAEERHAAMRSTSKGWRHDDPQHCIDSLRARLAEREREAARYRYLRPFFRHYKWTDVDPIHEIQPEGEKYISDAGLDAAIDAALRASDGVGGER